MNFFEVAEQHALDELVNRGFNVVLTPPGPDGGVDVIGEKDGIAAQVKATLSPIGAPAVQQLVGAANQRGIRRTAFFSVGGFTDKALSAADILEVALFKMDLTGKIHALNSRARGLYGNRNPEPGLVETTRASKESFHARERRYRDEIENGSTESLALLAHLLSEHGREEDAGYWYRQAALAGDEESIWIMGMDCASSYDPDNQAERWFTLGAEAGSSRCMLELAELSDDVQVAEVWYLRAAEAGSGHEFISYAGFLAVSGRVEEAEEWYIRAAETGESYCIWRVGVFYRDRGDSEKAEIWYLKGAEMGDARCLEELGDICERKREFGAAERFYLQAVESGGTNFFRLGHLYSDSGDDKSAEHWYLKGADEGDVYCIYHLANLYSAMGDYDSAILWYGKGVDVDGAERFAYPLARLYEFLGDHDVAMRWYLKGRKAGDERCIGH